MSMPKRKEKSNRAHRSMLNDFGIDDKKVKCFLCDEMVPHWQAKPSHVKGNYTCNKCLRTIMGKLKKCFDMINNHYVGE